MFVLSAQTSVIFVFPFLDFLLISTHLFLAVDNVLHYSFRSFSYWEIPWTEEPGGLQSMGSQELDTT